MDIKVSISGDVVSIQARELRRQIEEVKAFILRMDQYKDTDLQKHAEFDKLLDSCDDVVKWERQELKRLEKELAELEKQ